MKGLLLGLMMSLQTNHPTLALDYIDSLLSSKLIDSAWLPMSIRHFRSVSATSYKRCNQMAKPELSLRLSSNREVLSCYNSIRDTFEAIVAFITKWNIIKIP